MAIADLFRRLPDRSAGITQLPRRQNASLIATTSPAAQYDELTLMGISAFRRGVNLIAGTVGMLPMVPTRKGVEVDERFALIERPCPWEDRQTTIMAAVRSLKIHGNYLAILGDVDATGWPQSIVPVPARAASVSLTEQGLVYRITAGIQSAYYRSVDVLHIKGPLSPGDLVGRGALADGTSAIALATSVDDASSNFYARGVYPSGVLKPDFDMDQAEADETRASWVSRVKRNEPVVLPPGLEFTPLASPTAEALQLEMASRMSRTQIADLLDLDPDWLDASASSKTYANIVDKLANLVRLTLQQDIVRIETAFSSLLPRSVGAKLCVDELQRGQTLERFQAYAIATGGVPWMLVDEVRESEGMEPMAQELAEPPAEDNVEGAD